jgi:hypothetical protein
MNNPYIKPLQFDEGGYAVGAFYRYQYNKKPDQTGVCTVYAWPNERETSEFIGSAVGGYAGAEETLEDIANRHNVEQIARYLTPVGCERLGIDL